MTNYSPDQKDEGTPNHQAPQWENPHGNSAQPDNPNSHPSFSQSVPHYSNPYGNQLYGAAPMTGVTNKNAIIALVVSLSTLFILCGIPLVGTITAIVSIVFGHKGLNETREVPNSGRGMALAGTICGYLALAVSIVIVAIYVLLFALGLGSTY